MQASSRDAGKGILCAFRSHLPHVRHHKRDLIRHSISSTPSIPPTHSRSFSATVSPNVAATPTRRGGLADLDLRGHSSYRLDLGRNGGDDRRQPSGADGSKRRSHGPDRNKRGKGRPLSFNAPPRKFTEVLFERLKAVKEELKDAPITAHMAKDGTSFSQQWRTFVSTVTGTQPVVPEGRMRERQRALPTLKDAFQKRGINGLDDRIKYAFYDHVTGSRFTESDVRNQITLADLRYPTEWYPATRTMHRTIHLHVGPTNSGKTYHALKRLEQAESGVYAGPLRLLAHEVYTRMNAKGKRCTLVTGEEKRSPDDTLTSEMQSCTVEMMPLNKTVDVAVIDEIQMIGNADRGWAWTQAVLGVKAREVHLCGEARTVPLIRELCASIGEKLEVHEYKRLSPLQMSDQSINGNLKLLRKGDCIVSFTVMGIHALRREIEKITGRKVATVYGSLPPETRAQQARLFNDPDNEYDFLVASDAIGMGLNLSIKRILFETSSKFDGYQRRTLSIADIKQIGGRAGRYRSAHQDNASAKAVQDVAAAKGEEPPVEISAPENAPQTATLSTATSTEPNAGQSETEPTVEEQSSESQAQPIQQTSQSVGLVTTLEKFDYPIIAAAMKAEPEPIRTAGIFPPASVVERFATYFPPGTPFSYILMRLHELSQMHTRFHLCGLKDQLWIADLIESAQGLTTTDRNILCACPASKSDADLYKRLMPAFARCIEMQSGGSLLDMPEMPLEALEIEPSASREYLRELERLHKGLVSYLWLSYRFAGIFSTRPLAFHVKGLVEEKIEQVLSQFSFTEARRRKIAAKREQTILAGVKEDDPGEQTQSEASEEIDLDEVPAGMIGSDILVPEAQTSYTAGGDRFSGEEDAVIMDPAEEVDDSLTALTGTTSTPEGTADLPPKDHASSFAYQRTPESQVTGSTKRDEKLSNPASSPEEDPIPETSHATASSDVPPLYTQTEPPSVDAQDEPLSTHKKG